MRLPDPTTVSARHPRAGDDCIDARLLGLLPWLASRFDLSDGAFRGEGEESRAPAGLLAAQGRAIFQTLGIHSLLPHIVRTKLDRWPAVAAASLGRTAKASPLAHAAHAVLARPAEAFHSALLPYASSDFGYALRSGSGAPGSLAAAYHLLVIVRPLWFAARVRLLPRIPDGDVASLNDRLLTAHAP